MPRYPGDRAESWYQAVGSGRAIADELSQRRRAL